MEEIKNSDYQFDMGSIIAGHEIYKNNLNAVCFDEGEFCRFIDNAANMARAVTETACIPKLMATHGDVFSEDEIKKAGYRFGFICATQRMHNIYPLFDIDVLKDFRFTILAGFTNELTTVITPAEEIRAAIKLFLDDELRKCISMRGAVEEYLKSPSQRVQRAKAISVINQYVEFLSLEMTPVVEPEDKNLHYFLSDLSQHQLVTLKNMLVEAKLLNTIPDADWLFIFGVQYHNKGTISPSNLEIKWRLTSQQVMNLMHVITKKGSERKAPVRYFFNGVDSSKRGYDDKSRLSKELLNIVDKVIK